MKKKETVTVVRKGGKYELIGFMLIVLGIIFLFIKAPIGIVLGIVGFIVFLIGRFF